MQISILVPTYNRPEQLAEALASLAVQDHALIGEVLVGDDSSVQHRAAIQAVIAASPIAHLIEYLPNDPPKGTYPNQCFLGTRARCSHILILHHDDHLCPGALAALAAACTSETDPRVKIWFGRNLIMDEQGVVDMARTTENDRHFGKDGPSIEQPLWQWALTESVPPNSFLIGKDTYTRYMQGPRDGNVGDWGLTVRLANSGAWGRFIAQYISAYRVQVGSVTSAGRGVDVHLSYELAEHLAVPPEALAKKRRRFSPMAPVAAVRYARDGERLNAWKCLLAPGLSWRQRLSARACATALMLLTPRGFWIWALRYRD